MKKSLNHVSKCFCLADLNNTMDAFVGKFTVEKRENYDGFFKGLGEYFFAIACLSPNVK